jgi:hypothetical protein
MEKNETLVERNRCADLLIRRAMMDTHPGNTLALAAEILGGEEAYHSVCRMGGMGVQAALAVIEPYRRIR